MAGYEFSRTTPMPLIGSDLVNLTESAIQRPHSPSIQFAIPPPGRVAVENVYDLPRAKGKACFILVLRHKVMHRQDVFRGSFTFIC